MLSGDHPRFNANDQAMAEQVALDMSLLPIEQPNELELSRA
jgi:hypothetical protein